MRRRQRVAVQRLQEPSSSVAPPARPTAPAGRSPRGMPAGTSNRALAAAAGRDPSAMVLEGSSAGVVQRSETDEPDERLQKRQDRLVAAVKAGELKRVQRALRHAAPDLPDGRGEYALIEAARLGNRRLVTLLLDTGASPNVQSQGFSDSGSPGETPLIVAAIAGDVSLATLLLDRGADMGKGDRIRMVPPEHAAFHGRIACVALFLDRGWDIQHRNGEGHTLLHFAARTGHTELARWLVGKGIDLAFAAGAAAAAQVNQEHYRRQATGYETLVDPTGSGAAAESARQARAKADRLDEVLDYLRSLQ